MDTHIIAECTAQSLAGRIAFPQVVAKLVSGGVERYLADLVGRQKISYGVGGGVHTEPLPFDGPEVARAFDGTAVKAAIEGSQQGRIDYQTFLRRVMEAGCSHYEVYLTGRKAIYLGRDGGQHIEHFPAGM